MCVCVCVCACVRMCVVASYSQFAFCDVYCTDFSFIGCQLFEILHTSQIIVSVNINILRVDTQKSELVW